MRDTEHRRALRNLRINIGTDLEIEQHQRVICKFNNQQLDVANNMDDYYR